MRPLIFCFPTLAILFLLKLYLTKNVHSSNLFTEARPFDRNSIIGCAPSITNTLFFPNSDRKMVPLPGWGNHQWKIETVSDSAQFYFNQGLNLFYSFHMEEAKASFLEAQRHDPNCAMAYWGQTMAEGPYINVPGYNPNEPQLINAIEKAEALAVNSLEKAIIQAQKLRFTKEKNLDIKKMMVAYKDAMQDLYERHRSVPELAVLCADAQMLVNPRNWYDATGQEKQGTLEIISLLEQILATNPNHPAALHYYIHMVEPSNKPELARDEADRLMPLLPSVAHMVHMPSHIYIRTGDYTKGVVSNKEAIRGYNDYKKALAGWEGNRLLYLYHNADMQGTNAIMMGNYAEAQKALDQNQALFNPADTSFYTIPMLSNFLQFITAQPYLLDVRFGNWQKLLKSKGPVTSKAYHQVLWQFGQGMALAKTGRIETAWKALNRMKDLMKDSSMYNSRPNRNRAIDGANIASLILEGTIYAEQKKWNRAIQLFEAAVKAEDTLRYSEPEDWRIPSRQFLGQVYLLKKDYTKAQQLFEEDLKEHPNNFWALNGLHDVLIKQQRVTASKALVKKYRNIFAAADIKLTGAVY